MKFPKKTLQSVPIEGKTVLLRADYNVPLENGAIADDYRITQSLPTVNYLLERGCKVIICAHLGRPEGKPDPKYSLEPVATKLGELLGQPVTFIPINTGDRVVQVVKHLGPGKVALLENLRFNPGEEANDPKFAESLAKSVGADYFVQDGFGVVHRAHASTDAITHFLPSVAGLLLEREYTTIVDAVESPKKPFVAILGGAKVSDKIKVIHRFVELADTIIIGGAMANNFLKYRGHQIGKSLVEEGLEGAMKDIYDAATQKVGEGSVDDFLVLPTDVAVATEISAEQRRTVIDKVDIRADEIILDIGPRSIETAVTHLKGAGTVIWNGTLGYAEYEPFAVGSARIALQLAQQPSTTSIIGGGDTADFVLHWDARKGGSFTHVSTGGGASLELMAGDPMPGIDALLDA
jgi:phosphoglycerate kinase